MRVFPLALFICLPALVLAAKPQNNRQGFVTAIPGPESFLLDGQPVYVNQNTRIAVPIPDGVKLRELAPGDLSVGERITVEGHHDGKNYVADKIETSAVLPVPGVKYSGDALTLVASPLQAGKDGKGWSGILLADGRRMNVTPETHVAGAELMKANSVPSGVWMKYDATRSAAGEWSVTSFALRADSALPDEAKQTEALDKHLTAPDYNAGTAGKYKLGLMHYTIEADRAANERMQAIADKLLASVAEPMAARGEWHFYITKANLFPLGFSTGHAVFIEDKLYHATDGRDDLLAGILAYHMADILEKEDARAIVRRRREGRVELATEALALVPVAGIGLAAAGGILAEAKAFESPEALIWAQDDRVGMRLLSDAGYDPVSLPLVLRIAEKPADEVDGWDSKPGLFYSIAMQQFRENYTAVPKLKITEPERASATRVEPGR